MRGFRCLIAGGIAAAMWVAFAGCSDENASLSEVQRTGGAAGSAGATQDASSGGSGGGLTGGSAGSSAGGGSGGQAGGSAGSSSGGSSGGQSGGSAGSSSGGASGGQSGGSAGAATGGAGGAPETGGSAPDAGAGAATQSDASPDAQQDAEGGAGGCSLPSDCDDGIPCTVDTCSKSACLHWPGTGCPVGQVCTAAGCVTSPICATTAQCEAQWANDPCKANVVCDGPTSTCKFTALDKDGDGRPPPVCGGDDCDDSNNTVAPTKPELCDGFDNNCDGSNNEGSACAPDDPCPTEAIKADCSGQCQPVSGKCDTMTCTASPSLNLWETDFPAVVRTPSQPGNNGTCANTCPLYPTAVTLGVRLHAPAYDGQGHEYRVEVRVPPQWKVKYYPYPAPDDICKNWEAMDGCNVVGVNDVVFITTSNPYAPAANVRFALIPWNEVYCK